MPSQLRDLICSGKADGLRLSTGAVGSCESKEMTIAPPPLVKQRRSRDPELTQNLILKAATDAFAKIGRSHVCTPVTNAQLVCRLLLDKTTTPLSTSTNHS